MRTVFTILLVAYGHMCYGQEVNIGLGYTNSYSKQFDNLVRTYNFSRPYLLEKQPLLSHGFHSSVTYLFGPEKELRSGVAVNYSLISSRADNEHFDVALSYNAVELGYFLRYSNKRSLGNFFGDFGINAVLGLLNKRINDEPLIVDESSVKSYHIGGSVSVNIGYWFELTEQLSLSPKLGLYYSPYLTEGESEAVINGTTNLVSEQYHSFLKVDVGVLLQIKPLKLRRD